MPVLLWARRAGGRRAESSSPATAVDEAGGSGEDEVKASSSWLGRAAGTREEAVGAAWRHPIRRPRAAVGKTGLGLGLEL